MMAAYRFPARKDQTDADRARDLQSWKMLGHRSFRGTVLCEATSHGHYICSEWAGWTHSEKRYCGHHAPAGAVRR